MSTVLQHVIDAASFGSLYALLAIGIALIFGILNLINFAYGELIMIGAYSLYVFDGLPFVMQVAVSLLVVVAAAVLMERIAFRPVRGATAPVLLVTSFAVSFALQNIAVAIFGARAKGLSLPSWFDHSIALGSVRFSSLALITVVSVAVIVTLFATFLRKSMMGIQMRAAAESFTTARLIGVRANMVIAVAFAISGLFAGIAAILITAQSGTITPTMGAAPVLIAFVATIIGGLGSMYGAAIGGFCLGVATVVLQVLLPADLLPYRDAFVYAGVFLILVVRPQGLVVVKALFERV